MLNLDELLAAADAARPIAPHKSKAAPVPGSENKAFLGGLAGALLSVVIDVFDSNAAKCEDDPYENVLSPSFDCKWENIDSTRPFLEQWGEQQMSPYTRLW